MLAPVTRQIPSKESQLCGPVKGLFSTAEYHVKHEAPFGLKRIDLFFWRRKGNSEIVAVELKLRNWRGAVWQAVHNRQVATRSYIALPAKSVGVVDTEILRSLGLGLISVDLNDARIIMQAKRSLFFNPRVAYAVLANIRRGSHV
jgi:hypothetical protein